jgi:DNA-binding SARP family transcriptional activator
MISPSGSRVTSCDSFVQETHVARSTAKQPPKDAQRVVVPSRDREGRQIADELDFRLLGPLEVLRSGRAVPLPSGRQRDLLAVLVLHANEVLDTDRLIDAVWDDRPPKTARAAFHGYVTQLRRALPADRIVTRAGDGYVLLVEPEEVDVHRFERLVAQARTEQPKEAAELLRRALRLWRGPPLQEFRNKPFAQLEILRLEELRLAAIEERAEADLALGRHRELVSELERLNVEHPHRERLAAHLMLAQYRSGRQVDALEVYRRTRRTLVEELGIDPGPELRQLERRILTQDTDLETRDAAERQPAPAEKAYAKPPSHDELRLVTVLFADVVGSSGLGERLGPDEVKALIGECVTMMSTAVEEYGGTVQAYQGDGICAYFGVPSVHEDDQERGARAALRIVEVVGEYSRDIAAAWNITDFAVRVGVNTGRTAVGLVGAGDPQTVALGDTTNVAARLQSLAEPGTIVVGPETARLLSPRFVLEPLGERTVKGREASVAVSRLVGAKAREPREASPPMVGRDDELSRLRSALDDLVSGRGRIVLLTGEAGIGKTRLLGELRTLAADRVTWLEGRCLSYGGPTNWPFIEALLGWLGADIGEPEIALRTKARAKLQPLLGSYADNVLPALGRLLRLRVDTAGADDVAAGYVRWLEALAVERPVVVALEDVHWADRAARELAESVLDLTDRAPVALVLTQEPLTRSEGATLRMRALGDFGHRTAELVLRPLSDEAASQLVVGIVGDRVDASTRAGLLREGEGNPLYLEELARAFLEGVFEPRGRTWTISLRSAELLPPALENVLVARIDRLPDGARRLSRMAAAIGRTFPVRVLEALAGGDVRDDLATLLRHEIVREARRYPDFECEFAHGLLQDAALSALTPAAKRTLYTEVAAAYESLYSDALDEHAERLAHYHAQAGNLPRALEYAERGRR